MPKLRLIKVDQSKPLFSWFGSRWGAALAEVIPPVALTRGLALALGFAEVSAVRVMPCSFSSSTAKSEAPSSALVLLAAITDPAAAIRSRAVAKRAMWAERLIVEF